MRVRFIQKKNKQHVTLYTGIYRKIKFVQSVLQFVNEANEKMAS